MSVANAPVLTDEEILRHHADGVSVYSLSKRTGIPQTTLNRRFKRLGLDVSAGKKVSASSVKDRVGEILGLHKAGVPRGEIARRLGCNHSSVSRLLKELGCGASIRTWHFDETFFDTIDTEEKAYAFGVFTADGNNTGTTVSFRMCDYDVIQKIRDAVGHPAPITPVPPRGKNKQTFYMANFCSAHMCSSLASKGCAKNKTFTTRFPDESEVPRHLIRHYIRGVFDGDGSLHWSENRHKVTWTITIAGTKPLLDTMLSCVRRESGVAGGGVYAAGKIFTLKIGGNVQVASVLDWMYRDASIFMDRKKDLAEQMMAETPPASRRS